MNNFDTSTTGVELDLKVEWDGDLARIFFDECFHIEWREGGSLLNSYSNVNLLQYIEHGNIEPLNLLCESSYNFNKNDIKEALIGEYGEEELKDQSMFRFDKYFSQLTKSELFDLVYELAYDSKEAIQFYYEHLTPKFTVISSRGYC